MNVKSKKMTEGFTIIEAIVVIVVVAIFGTFLYSFLGSSDKNHIYWQSHVPRQNLVRAKDLNQVMENIRADYKPYPVWTLGHTYNVGDKVMPTAFSLSGQRYWYICTQPGKSGTTEPDPWTTGVIPPDGNVLWAYQTTPPLLTLSDLYNKIGTVDTSTAKYVYDKSTNQYGYYVTEKKWIDFDSNNTEPVNESSNHNILKVTISAKDGSGSTVATVTALFF